MIKTLGYGFMQEGEDLEQVLAQYRAGTGLHDSLKGAVDEAADAIAAGDVPRFAKIVIFSMTFTEHKNSQTCLKAALDKRTKRVKARSR